MSDESVKREQQIYVIRIRGRLEDRWTAWFENMVFSYEEDGITILSGPLEDQAALHGILSHIRNLNLQLISVQTIEKGRNRTNSDNGRISSMIHTNPLYGFIRTLLLFISGKVQFNQSDVGKTILMGDGKTFEIFRRVTIRQISDHDSKPQGLFIVRFTPKMDIQKNIRLSKIMLLIFMGFKGFRSKYWCVDRETGICQGIYEWDKLEDAERYSKSIAMRNMTKRSVPGTVSFSVLDNSESNRDWKILDTE